jgi:hypothetical protein
MEVTGKNIQRRISAYIIEKKIARGTIQTTYAYLTGTKKNDRKYLTMFARLVLVSFDANEQE